MTILLHRKDGSNSCPICLLQLKKPISSCKNKHKFHKDCLSNWRLLNNSCPLCRVNLSPMKRIRIGRYSPSLSSSSRSSSPVPLSWNEYFRR